MKRENKKPAQKAKESSPKKQEKKPVHSYIHQQHAPKVKGWYKPPEIAKKAASEQEEIKSVSLDYFDYGLFVDESGKEKFVVSRSRFLKVEADQIAINGSTASLSWIEGKWSMEASEKFIKINRKTLNWELIDNYCDGAVPVWVYELGSLKDVIDNITESGTDSGGEEHGSDNV